MKAIFLKTLTLFILILGFNGVAQAQTEISAENLTPTQANWLIRSGFNLRKYDWKNDDVNYHLDLAIKYRKGSSLMRLGGVGSSILGSILMIYGFSEYGLWGEKLGVGVLGSILFVGGTTTWLIGGKRSRNSRYNLERATDIYSR